MNHLKFLSQPMRRGLVLFIPCGFVTAFILRFTEGQGIAIVETLLTFASFAALLTLLLWLGPRFSEALIDERDQQVRNALFYRTSMVMVMGIFALFLILQLLLISPSFEQAVQAFIMGLATDLDKLLHLLTQLIMLFALTPMLVLVWLEPDPIPDDTVALSQTAH